jgi:precorrin-6B methylase 1
VTRGRVRPATSRRGSLIVVGTGIGGVGQTTLEAVACIEQAEKVFHSVVEPTTELWLRQLNPTATTLTDLYGEGKDRSKTYAEMTARLVTAVRSGLRVCAVFYGHPGVLADPSHRAIRQLRREGYSARMLPGVSADGCLYADLGINPGENGVQSFEATDFLMSRRRFDPTSGVILWQIGVLGESDVRVGATCRPDRLQTLTAVLRRHYPAQHRVILYYASTFPAHPPIVQRVGLSKLPQTVVNPMAMLYVPALAQRPIDMKIARWFDET